MEYVHLGRSGLLVSRLCLGTMNFGPLATREDSHDIMDHALDAGINFFDTANIYGLAEPGLTERIIGEWLSRGAGRRDRIVLATKVYCDMGKRPNEGRLSAFHIRKSCDDSLRRLQTDHIDLFQMHHVDLATPWEEIWEAMELLRQQGKITYVGASNFAGWNLAQGQEVGSRRGNFGLVSEQSIYNIAERTIELEVIPAAQEYGIGIIPWSPLHGGVLGGVLRKQAAGTAGKSVTAHAARRLEKLRPALVKWEALCDDLGSDPARMALSWLLHRPGVTAPIIGPRTKEHLDDAVASLSIELDDQVLARMDEIFPGPGPAPQAYAW